MEDCQVIYQK